MDKAKHIDRLKDLVIVLLFVSALLLLYRAVFYETTSPFTHFLSGSTAETDGTATAATLSTKPATVLVTGLDGTHTAAKYDRDAREKLLTAFSASLGEALGSAGDARSVSDDEWHSALRGSGVFFDYLYPQPLSVVAASLGTTAKNSVASAFARRLCLSIGEDSVRLYYIGADGGIFRCSTALSASSLSAKLGDYRGGEAKYAFELGGEYAAIDPCFIFSGEDTKLQAVSAANPLTESGELTKLFTIFGMSAHASSGYIEKGGSVVYVEGSKSLRMDNNAGSVLFSVADGSGVSIAHSGELTTAEIVAACAGICKASIGADAGAAELTLVSCETDNMTGATDVNFAYAIAGIPVTLADGAPAATFKVSGSSIIRAELCFRRYSYTGETLTAPPETTAAAIAKAGGGEPLLTYDDRSDGVAASWIVR